MTLRSQDIPRDVEKVVLLTSALRRREARQEERCPDSAEHWHPRTRTDTGPKHNFRIRASFRHCCPMFCGFRVGPGVGDRSPAPGQRRATMPNPRFELRGAYFGGNACAAEGCRSVQRLAGFLGIGVQDPKSMRSSCGMCASGVPSRSSASRSWRARLLQSRRQVATFVGASRRLRAHTGASRVVPVRRASWEAIAGWMRCIPPGVEGWCGVRTRWVGLGGLCRERCRRRGRRESQSGGRSNACRKTGAHGARRRARLPDAPLEVPICPRHTTIGRINRVQ